MWWRRSEAETKGGKNERSGEKEAEVITIAIAARGSWTDPSVRGLPLKSTANFSEIPSLSDVTKDPPRLLPTCPISASKILKTMTLCLSRGIACSARHRLSKCTEDLQDQFLCFQMNPERTKKIGGDFDVNNGFLSCIQVIFSLSRRKMTHIRSTSFNKVVAFSSHWCRSDEELLTKFDIFLYIMDTGRRQTKLL